MSEVAEAATTYRTAFKAWQDANHALFMAEAAVTELREAASAAVRAKHLAGQRLLTIASIREAR